MFDFILDTYNDNIKNIIYENNNTYASFLTKQIQKYWSIVGEYHRLPGPPSTEPIKYKEYYAITESKTTSEGIVYPIGTYCLYMGSNKYLYIPQAYQQYYYWYVINPCYPTFLFNPDSDNEDGMMEIQLDKTATKSPFETGKKVYFYKTNGPVPHTEFFPISGNVKILRNTLAQEKCYKQTRSDDFITIYGTTKDFTLQQFFNIDFFIHSEDTYEPIIINSEWYDVKCIVHMNKLGSNKWYQAVRIYRKKDDSNNYYINESIWKNLIVELW